MEPQLDGDFFLSRGQVDRFTKALAQAVHDKTLEQSHEIRFYYDADVIVWLVFGFRNFEFYHKTPSPQLLLMRALLAAGYLGTAHLLRPHALELDSLIRRQSSLASSRTDDGYKKRVREFLRHEGIDKHLERLSEIARSDQSDEDKIDEFLRELQDVGAETFAAIEMVHGTWEERLRRLHGPVLVFQDLEEGMPTIMQDPQVWRFNRMIAGERTESRLSMSNLHDAAALAIIHKSIQDYEQGDGKILVRFHSDTPSLTRAWRKRPEMKAALSYKEVPGVNLWFDERFAFRDLDYFIVRASFESLCFPGLERRGRELPAVVSLGELRKVAGELSVALRNLDVDGLRRVSEIGIGKKNLKEVLWELETLSFIRNVWVQYKPPESLRRIVLELPEILALSSDRTTRTHLRNEIRKEVELLRGELGDKVAMFREWEDLLRQVQVKADELRKGLRPHEVPEPMRDLGLVRWSLDLDEGMNQRLRELAENLISPDDFIWSQACANVASLAEGAEDSESCILACSVLWALSLFDEVVEAVNNFEDSQADGLPFSLLLMRAAARLRGRISFSRTEKEKHIRWLLGSRGRSEVPNGRVLLGLGYVLFYAWYSERHQTSGSQETGDHAVDGPLRWAKLSFEIGEEAVKALSEDGLGRAFAINHCAYVGRVCEIESVRTEVYLDLLRQLRGQGEWHYRFADTIAYSDFLAAKALWYDGAGETKRGKEERIRRCCSLLKGAQGILDTAVPSFGDPEIPQHKMEIDALIKTIGC